MTKLKDAGTWPGAMNRALETLEFEGCQTILNRSRSQIYNYADEAHPSYPTIDQAYLLDMGCLLTGHTPFLDVYLRKIDALRCGKGTAMPLEISLFELNAALGHVNQSIADAVSPASEGGVRITDNERRVVNSMLQECFNKLHQLQRRIGKDPASNIHMLHRGAGRDE